jgi:hypothetical protein
MVLGGALCLDALDVSMVGVALPSIRTALFLITGVALVGALVALAGLRRTPDVVPVAQPVPQPVAGAAAAGCDDAVA